MSATLLLTGLLPPEDWKATCEACGRAKGRSPGSPESTLKRVDVPLPPLGLRGLRLRLLEEPKSWMN